MFWNKKQDKPRKCSWLCCWHIMRDYHDYEPNHGDFVPLEARRKEALLDQKCCRCGDEKTTQKYIGSYG